jgi:hypothetical protein
MDDEFFTLFFFTIEFKGFGTYRYDKLSSWVVLNKNKRNEAGGSAGGSAGEKRPISPARGREASAGRWRSRPARADGIASLSPALERPPGREAGEREARHWRGESAGESDVARSDWSTCRDLISPRVLAVATSRF